MAAEDDAFKIHRDLLIACGWGKEIDVILLLQQGASVRVQDQDGKNCLHYAACKGHIQVTNILIESGCSINAKDKSEQTPLHLAAEEGHHDIVSILLDNNVEVNVQDAEGGTPLHSASVNGHFEVVELLIHIKAELNLRNKDGFTPLLVATDNHHVKSMDLLLKAGANKHAVDLLGNTALHIAVMNKSLKATKMLTKHGVDVNIQNHDGNTALHLATDAGYQHIVEVILDSEQPIELSPNNVGDTAKDIAIQRGYRDIVQMIPDPQRKEKRRSRRPKRNSENLTSPTSPGSQQPSRHSSPAPPENNNPPMSLLHEGSRSATPPTNLIMHPSEEVPSVTSSSVNSLWVPTTDSGISLPMDANFEKVHSSVKGSASYKRRHKHDKSKLMDEKGGDEFARDPDRSHRHSQRRGKHHHSLDDSKFDSRHPSTKSGHRQLMEQTPSLTQQQMLQLSPHRVRGRADMRAMGIGITSPARVVHESGSVSDESIHFSGCLPQFNKNKLGRCKSTREKKGRTATDTEKMIIDEQQRQLKLELETSKQSLEKQMRKMRKKFDKALRLTDERFVEQKRREEQFHNNLRIELEMIEKSLERGSKKNVEEFTGHIRAELNNLAIRLTKGYEVSQSDLSIANGTVDSPRTKNRPKRTSAIDLDKDISVSLKDVKDKQTVKSPYRSRKSESYVIEEPSKDQEPTRDITASASSPPSSPPASPPPAATPEQAAVHHWYQKKLKELDSHWKERSEKDSEALKARIRELELLMLAKPPDQENVAS